MRGPTHSRFSFFYRLILILGIGFTIGPLQIFAFPYFEAMAATAIQTDDSFLFLRGRVRLLDGSPPPELIRVELVCGRYVREQIYTDENGNFVFQVGQNQNQGWTDASVSQPDSEIEIPRSPFKTVNLGSCEIRITEGQGFSGTSIKLGSRSAFDSPDVGDLFVDQEGSQQGSVVSVTSLAAPPKAAKAFNKAQEELQKDKPNVKKVEKELKRAIKEYGEFASAWQILGEIRQSQGKIEEARKAFMAAIQADMRYVTPHLSLARLDMYQENWSQALEHSQRVIELGVRSPQAFYFAGLSNYFLGNFPAAKESFLELKSTGSEDAYPIALLHLGIIYSRQGNPSAAALEFQKYLQLMPEDKMPKGQKEQISRQLESWRRQGLLKPKAETRVP